MALTAGVMSITLEYAKDLKDKDWFGKQDPYAIIRVGGQEYRTRTAVDAGKNPVWNETFHFNCINDNTAEVVIMDEDVASRDDTIGTAIVSLARAREAGTDRQQAPVVRKNKKQCGFLSVNLKWEPNIKPQQQAQAQQAMPYAYGAPAPGMYGQPQGGGFYPPPQGYQPQQSYPPQQGYQPQQPQPQQYYGQPPPGAYQPYTGYPPRA